MNDLNVSTRIPQNQEISLAVESAEVDYVVQSIRSPATPNCGLHAHPMLQYTLVLEGRQEYAVWQQTSIVTRGCGFFVNHDRLHEWKMIGDGHGEIISLLINPELVCGAFGSPLAVEYMQPYLAIDAIDSLFLDPSVAEAKEILDATLRIYRYEQRKELGYPLAIRAEATQIWLNTLKLMRDVRAGQRILPPSSDKLRIDKIIQFIHLNYKEKLTLDDLANCAEISRGECCRLFQRTVNRTPIEFLNRYRIRQSQVMLQEAEYTILRIAEECGFPSVNHFITMFKRYAGCTPREYRKHIFSALQEQAT
jgi:AraC-like DNA-binding protein